VPSALVLFGSQLKKLREARDLSQERLGELCNFERQYVGRIERGERVISFEGMMRIAFNLQVRPADLYKQIPIPNRMQYSGQKKAAMQKSHDYLSATSIWMFPKLLYPLHTSRLSIHVTPATRHPEASHANCKYFGTVSAKPEDRLRCTAGLSKAPGGSTAEMGRMELPV
jgi:transcriptional regulator with XRE-family HTH domain